MKGTSTELKVGIFAIIVIVFLSYMTYKIGSLPMIWEKGYRLYVDFDDIKGLDEQSRIKIAGVDVGVVERIDLVDGRARTVLLVNPKIKIYRDATAYLKMSGLLGDRYLALSTGTQGGLLLKDGDSIHNAIPAADVDMLASQLASAAKNIASMTSNFNSIFGDEEKKSIRESIRNLSMITANLKDISDENIEPLRRVIAQLDEFTGMLNKRGPGVMDDLGRVAKNWADNGPELIANLDKAVTELKDTVGENRDAIRESMENIRSTSKSASVIAGKIERGEGTIGRLMNDESLYEAVQNISEEAGKSVNVFSKMRTFVNLHSEYNSGDSESKGYFDLTIKPRKDKYYIFGVVTDPKGSVETRETTINGITTTEEEVKSKIEFSVQFAKRFDDFAIRIGLIENTFGVGTDYFFHDDRGRVKLDIWDFSAKEVDADKAHAKLGVDYNVFKNLFVNGGLDNAFNSARRGIYLGGGIKFEDEDLKYLLGKLPGISFK